MEHGRPFVTWNFATTLDGRSAAIDGSSRWVSSVAARLDTHRLRALCDTMLVGANTIAVDDPHLTVRDPDGVPPATAAPCSDGGARPRPGPAGLRRRRRDRPPAHPRPGVALKDLFARDRQHVFLEGGPTLAAAFLAAGLVDEVVTYVAPMLLGAGRTAVGDLGITTVTDRLHLPVTDVTVLAPVNDGDDVNVRITMGRAAAERTSLFTGIVEELGTVAAVERQSDAARLTVRATTVLEDAAWVTRSLSTAAA